MVPHLDAILVKYDVFLKEILERKPFHCAQSFFHRSIFHRIIYVNARCDFTVQSSPRQWQRL